MKIKIPWLLIYIKVLLVLSAVMYVETESIKNNTKIMKNDSLEDVLFKVVPNDNLFRISLSKRRKEFVEIIQVIQIIDTDENKFKIIISLIKDVVESTENNTALIKNCMHNVPGYDLNDYIIGDALFIILENTIFLGDMIVYFPDIIRTILKVHKEWTETLYWSFNFIDKMKHLLDETMITVIYSAKKELGFTK